MTCDKSLQTFLKDKGKLIEFKRDDIQVGQGVSTGWAKKFEKNWIFDHFENLSLTSLQNRGEMKFSLLWESMGNFCILVVFERYLSNAWTHHTKYYLCRDNVCRRAPSRYGVHRLGGRGEGELKTQKMGGCLVAYTAQTWDVCLIVTRCSSY